MTEEQTWKKSQDQTEKKCEEQTKKMTEEETNTLNVECSDGKKDKTKKEVRQRKKKLINQLREQMEFYFSSANITKDRCMAGLLADTPYISLETFIQKFNKIRSLTDDINLLRKAVKQSEELELSEDGLMVKRTKEVTKKPSDEACTIYVENIPSHADHDWVRGVFGQYGTIDYVSLPRFKCSRRPKGFGFVEFQTPDIANLALQSFGAEDCKIPYNIDPAELQSIKTFEGNDTQGDSSKTIDYASMEAEETSIRTKEEENKEGKVHIAADIGDEETKKRKLDEKTEEHKEDCETKKRKVDDEGVYEEESNQIKLDTDEDKTAVCEKSKEDGTEGQMEVARNSKKKKRKRSKKVKVQEKVDSIRLKVMPKKDWRQLRNRYLNMQKENMQLLKSKMRESQSWRYSNFDQFSDYSNSRHSGMASDKYDRRVSEVHKTSGMESANTMPVFTPNVVVKISFEEPPQDPKKLRETIRAAGEQVVYVETSVTEKDVYARFSSEQAAASYRNSGCWSRMEIITGNDEKEYWEHIHLSWTQRRGKRNKVTNGSNTGNSYQERGREKLLQKAYRETLVKPTQHIVFED